MVLALPLGHMGMRQRIISDNGFTMAKASERQGPSPIAANLFVWARLVNTCVFAKTVKNWICWRRLCFLPMT